jgi:O-antigen ligase/polysaccharide polymerase Wzy-like membrane protein
LPHRKAKLRSEGRYALAADASVTAVHAVRSIRTLAVGAGAASSIAILGFADGGYYPTAWGWGALVALWFSATYLVIGNVTRPAPLALTVLGGLALLSAWTWLSLFWSDDVDQTVLEGQRTLLYVAVAGALVLVIRREDVEPLLGGALIGIFLPAGYGLLTRLFPDRLGVYEPIAGYRLQEPVGYWNALGLFAAMGAALAVGFAARGSLLVRTLAGAALPVLLTTTYFTFSRGAWLALGVGLVAAVAIDPRRLHLLAVGLVLAPASGLAIWLASRQDALTRSDAPLSAATDEGHRLALYVLVLVGVSAVAAAAFGFAERRVILPRSVPLAFAGGLALIVVAGSIAVFARYGGPQTIAQKGWDSFTARPSQDETDLRKRLFTFSGSYRVDLWRAALDDYTDHPVVGSGAGSYEHYWNEQRPFAHKVRDAHSLYLEVLAELGPVGLALLAIGLGVPLVAAFFARGHPLVPAALAAYVAYLVHAGVDWDWELPAVTIAALACGIGIVAAAGREDDPLLASRARWGAVAAALGLAIVAFVGLVGASALSTSQDALDRGRWEKAEDEARKASRWWRWSPEPWQRLGEAQLGAGDTSSAAASFRKAVAKDRHDWLLWYELASVTDGAEARQANAEAARLNRFYRSEVEEGSTRASR